MKTMKLIIPVAAGLLFAAQAAAQSDIEAVERERAQAEVERLAGEVRRSKIVTLTDAGRDAARQLLLGTGDTTPTVEILRMIERRPLRVSYLKRKVPNSGRAIRSLQKKGFLEIEDAHEDRDPLRASAARFGHLGTARRDHHADGLEFVLADALDQGATAVITTGGWQSNHCRATAIAAVRLGLRPASDRLCHNGYRKDCQPKPMHGCMRLKK